MLWFNKFRLIINNIGIPRISTTWSQNKNAPLHSQSTKQGYNVLFFGSDSFSLPSLKALYDNSELKQRSQKQSLQLNCIRDLAVVTSLKGPDNAVHSYAKTNGIPLHSWPLQNDGNVCQQFDIGVVVSFGHLIPGSIISAFALGMINVHASLLPKWRGAAPVIYSIMNGDRTTGVSIMKILPKHFDIGDILAQKEVAIGKDMLMPELHANLSEQGALLLVDCCKQLSTSLEHAKPQADAMVQYAPKVTASLAKIDWSNLTALQVYDRYRALFTVHSPATTWLGTQVKLVTIRYSEPTLEPSGIGLDRRKTPGQLEYVRSDKQLRVFCADNHYIIVERLSVAGKRTMSAADFYNGFMQKSKSDGSVPCFV